MRIRYAHIDLKYLLFSELYTRFDEAKSKRKAFALMEAAIACYSKKGFESVTMEMIAREAGVTRTLLKYYFSDAKEMHDFSIKYIRLLFQKLAVDAMEDVEALDEKLGLYVDACFYWVKNFRNHSRVWLAFLHRCSGNKNLRDLNTMASSNGADRISGLIEAGKKQGLFHATDSLAAAKAIQTWITGALILSVSENIEDEKSFVDFTRRQCLALAKNP